MECIMRTGMKKWIALLCALCLMAALLCPAALAVKDEEEEPVIHDIRVYVDSRRTSTGLKVEKAAEASSAESMQYMT